MLQDDRRGQILFLIAQEGSVTVPEIARRFHVSEMTARRDLRELHRKGLLQRIHGGAVSNLGRSYEPPYHLRSAHSTKAKRAIGLAAAKMISDGDSIILDIGTTTLEVARSIRDKHNVTIVTASLLIANEIVANFTLGAQVRLVLTGGIVRPGELSLVGPLPRLAYREFRVDKAFIGIGGLSLEAGLTEYNLEDALVKRPLLASARQRIVVADGSKFGRTAFARVGSLSRVNMVITDKSAPEDIVQALIKKDIEVVIAD